MGGRLGLKRVNVYVDEADLRLVAERLGCRPSEAVRRLIDNYLLAAEVDEVRRLPGDAPEQVFRRGAGYELPAEALDATEGEPASGEPAP